jgi:hypothetical protein
MEDVLVAEDSPHRNLMLSSGAVGEEVAPAGRLSASCPYPATAAPKRPYGYGFPKSLPGTVPVLSHSNFLVPKEQALLNVFFFKGRS